MHQSVPGFSAAGISAGIKSTQVFDLGLIVSHTPAAAAAVFTTNKIKAAPVRESLKRLQTSGRLVSAVLVNSGNANACTGNAGIEDVRMLCRTLSSHLNLPDDQVLMSSTGIIGVPLPSQQIASNLPRLVNALSPCGLNDFARAIMTTDTFPKLCVRSIVLDEREIHLCGIAKGAGMIMPRMATMLAFILTDCAVSPDVLDEVFRDAVEDSFNAITIDGDTSTNDMALILANGYAGNTLLRKDMSATEIFHDALRGLLQDLARLILQDAEGATKLVTIRVIQAKSKPEAKEIAYLVANSPLVKTAFFGEDPNWGRIMAAIGKTEHDIDPDNIDILINSLMVVQRSIATGHTLDATHLLKQKEFTITIDLHRGSATAAVGTTDLTTDYIKINSAYPT